MCVRVCVCVCVCVCACVSVQYKDDHIRLTRMINVLNNFIPSFLCTIHNLLDFGL